MSRRITPAEAAEQGEVIYQTGWPGLRGKFVWLSSQVWWAAWVAAIWIHSAGTAGDSPWTSVLLAGAVWALSLVVSLDRKDTVFVTRTAVRRRGYLGSLRGSGFRSVDLAPNSRLVLSKHADSAVLWVGSRPHGSSQDILTMNLRFSGDPAPLLAALASLGVGIEDEHDEWLLRRPILARLEMALPQVFLAPLPILVFIAPTELLAAWTLVAVTTLIAVHRKAR